MNAENLSKFLDSDDYMLLRLRPDVENPHYLHLTDLHHAVSAFRTDKNLRILDYGCGGSPYRSLFPNSEYVRADFTPCEGLDYLLPEDSSLPVPDASFDMVLSTQVLEHVPEPANFIAECYRVLKPGGTLLLTTHGTFEDHGCPYDFTRWTADGLSLLLKRAGFQISTAQKLTCGPRAVSFFMATGVPQLRAPKTSPFGFMLWGLRGVIRFMLGWFNRNADKYFKNFAIEDATAPSNTTYIALLMHAKRPEVEIQG